MKNLLRLIVGVGIFCVGIISVAAPLTPSGYPYHIKGAYIGIQGGVAGMDTRGISSEMKARSTGYSTDEGMGLSGRVYVGYLWGSDFLKYGAEAGGMMYQPNKYSLKEYNDGTGVYNYKWEYESYLLDLLAVGKVYVGSHLNFFAKAGFAFVEQEFSSKKFVSCYYYCGFKKTENKIIPEVQAGIGFTFNKNWDVNAAYLRTFGSKPRYLFSSDKEGRYNRIASVQGVMLAVEYHIL